MNARMIRDRLRSFCRIFSWSMVLLFPFGLVSFRNSWIDANQIVFHLPLVVGIWVMFRRRLTIFAFAFMIIMAAIIADLGLIDEQLHELLLHLELYPAFVVHQDFVNPQYAKLLLYVIVAFLLMTRTILMKKRNPEMVFVLISVIVAPLVTLTIHNEIVGQGLDRFRELALGEMQSIVGYAVESPSETSALCAHFKLRCLLGANKDRLLKEVGDAGFRKRITSEISSKDSSTFELGTLVHEEWHRLAFGFVRRGSDSYDIFFEDKRINSSQKRAEDSFGRLAMIANLIWGWLLIILGILHNSPNRRLVFRLSSSD